MGRVCLGQERVPELEGLHVFVQITGAESSASFLVRAGFLLYQKGVDVMLGDLMDGFNVSFLEPFQTFSQPFGDAVLGGLGIAQNPQPFGEGLERLSKMWC